MNHIPARTRPANTAPACRQGRMLPAEGVKQAASRLPDGRTSDAVTWPPVSPHQSSGGVDLHVKVGLISRPGPCRESGGEAAPVLAGLRSRLMLPRAGARFGSGTGSLNRTTGLCPNRSIPAFRSEVESAKSAWPRLAPNAGTHYPEPIASIGGSHEGLTPLAIHEAIEIEKAAACASRAEPRRLFRGLHSSSDGDPAIHQPRSNALGRARDRAMCPGVIRFRSRGGCGPYRPSLLAGVDGNGFRMKGEADCGPAARRFSSSFDGSLALEKRGDTMRGSRPARPFPREPYEVRHERTCAHLYLHVRLLLLCASASIVSVP